MIENFGETNHEIGDENITPKKNLPYIHYMQSTPIGCGVASLMMCLSGLQKSFIPSEEYEKSIIAKAKKRNGIVEISELLNIIDQLNIKMDCYFENSEYDFDINDPLVRNYYDVIKNLRRKRSLFLLERQNITIDLIKKVIDDNQYVMINGIAMDIPHMRVCYGYVGNKLLIADPLNFQPTTYNERQFQDNCTPPFGRWFVGLKY